MALKKFVGWSLLCMGAGGMVVNCVIMITDTSRIDKTILGFLTASIVLLAGSIWCLKQAYTVEPRIKRGPLQLSIMDLLAASFATGTYFMLVEAEVLRWGTFLYLPAFLTGLLVATQQAFATGSQRFLYGLGVGAWISGCGCMGGTLFFIPERVYFSSGDVSGTLQYVWEGFWGVTYGIQLKIVTEILFTAMLRTAFIGMPAGFLICWLINRTRSKPAPVISLEK